jgi:hypothetical protein
MGFPYDGSGFEPDRVFTVGTSDYSARVIKWPSIKRSTNQLKSTRVKIDLANTDQHFNNFYNNLYSIPNTCQITCDSYTLFTGFLKDVQYKQDKCSLTMRDKLSDLETKKVGDSTTVVSFAPQIPSDIAWTLCTCYGALDNVASTNNADIDYAAFLLWAETFSIDSIECEANYDGQKVSEALQDLSEITNSDIWIDRIGKVQFKARIDVSSNDALVNNDYIADLVINIAGNKLITDQYVYGAYSGDNNKWGIIVHHSNPTFVNSYGTYEDIIKKENIWHQNSTYAINLAQKKIAQYGEPPIEFNVKCPMALIDTTIADRIRLVDSFYSVTSASVWRVSEEKINIEAGTIEFSLDGAKSLEPFYLDVSLLDGNDLLL